ncbi:MAG TPA: YkgJ family cysteine cluster protein [Novosphingobium sp.]|jgi:hypothetical protein|nr:YkgJ family cysteine cluster protein [Novosphingobium sp.]
MDAAADVLASRPESEICLQCGLCCTGAIFDYAPLTAAELPFLVSGKFARWQDKAGFAFPCSQLDGACCTSYHDRPSVCRRYRCEVLVRLADGRLTRDDAARQVGRAGQLVNSALAAARDRSATIGELRRAFQSGQDGWAEAGPDERAALAPLRLALAALERHLDGHFRRPHQRQMAELPGATEASPASAEQPCSPPALRRARAVNRR